MLNIQQILNAAYNLFWLALRVFLAFCQLLIGSVYRAILRNKKLKPLSLEDLSLPLLAARLADLPYQIETAEQVERSLATLLADSKLLHFQEQELMALNSVWILAEGRLKADSELALFLIFRGTMSPTDAIADVMFRPDAGPSGVRCHGGFLRTVREDKTLHEMLAKHLAGSRPDSPPTTSSNSRSTGSTGSAVPAYAHMYIMGHSLGGALSMTIAGAGYLPSTFSGALTIISLGGPMVFYGEPDPSLLDRATSTARAISIVNANDIVPRLLGCPLAFTRKLLSLFASSNSLKKQKEQEEVLDTLEQYKCLPGTDLLFLHGGKAFRVPSNDRMLVLNLAEALHPKCISDHLGYVEAAEAAAGAEHWVAAGVDA